MDHRLVIANRGEIARRILRAARARGYAVAAISTAADADSLIRREVDAVLEVGSFLSIPEIVAASRQWGATLLHPGYGFLSENADFAQAVEDAGIGFVGPTPENMRAMGGKESAKAFARQCGVPVLDALLSHELAALGPDQWGAELAARNIHAPFLVKASGGGGGRGMRVVETVQDLPDAIRRASREAEASFHDGTVFVERYLMAPRHIEIQVFGDGLGGGVSLGERECSLQRRHQKVLEEAPSSVVDGPLREALGVAALALVRATRYRGAGTVEFLLDLDGSFHFLEMNTRLQVEHPVTELVHVVDLVRAQLELAEGHWPDALGSPAAALAPRPRGVALEARILAEDPRNGWLPTPGPLTVYREPSGPGIRVDSGVTEGDRINGAFDSMIAKLVVWAPNRAQAVARLAQALQDFIILGCRTNLPFLLAIARSEDFLAGVESTAWIGEHLKALNAPLLTPACQDFFTSQAFREALSCAFQGLGTPAPGPAERFAAQRHGDLRIGSALEQDAIQIRAEALPHRFTVTGPALARILGAARTGPSVAFAACRLGGSTMGLAVFGDTLQLEDPLARLPATRAATGSGTVQAPMGGRIVEVRVAVGDAVEEGQLLFVLESMKMQFEILAPRAGTVVSLAVEAGQILQGPDTLAVVD
jgi:acetyl/propionyl-CoA carboxylase alpha subunit